MADGSAPESTAGAAPAKATCPECGGRKFGRGFEHRAGCSLAFKPKSSGKRKSKAGKRGPGRPKGSKGSRAKANTSWSGSIGDRLRGIVDELKSLLQG